MSNATYWIFFGLMPATLLVLGLAGAVLNKWSIEADERKSKAGR